MAIARTLVGRVREAEQTHKELARFLLVGGSGTIVNMLVLFALHHLSVPILLAGLVSNETALVFNFFCHEHWTFAGDRMGTRKNRFLRFQFVATGGITISLTILAVLVHFGVHYLVANAIGISVAVGWNFAMSYRWAWRRTPIEPLEKVA